MFRRIYYILTLRCDEASRLISDSLDRKLTRVERVALRGHQFVCKFCTEKESQIETVHRASGHLHDSPSAGSSDTRSDTAAGMPDLVKQRMRDRISQEL